MKNIRHLVKYGYVNTFLMGQNVDRCTSARTLMGKISTDGSYVAKLPVLAILLETIERENFGLISNPSIIPPSINSTIRYIYKVAQ